jgi:hypothetical protein
VKAETRLSRKRKLKVVEETLIEAMALGFQG